MERYLDFIGFWDYLDFRHRSSANYKNNNQTRYMPITVLRRQDFEKAANGDESRLGSVIVTRSLELSKIVTGIEKTNKNESIAYCIREIIRNVFEHSGCDECYLYAQKYSSGVRDYEIELVILDCGVGISNTLRKNQNLEISSDSKALEMAIKPGVSRVTSESDNIYGNSGFGLYVLSQLGSALGDFSVCSGASCIRSRGSGSYKQTTVPNFIGTAIRLCIKRPKGKNINDYIDEIVKKGETEAKSTPFAHAPSKLSRSISVNSSF